MAKKADQLADRDQVLALAGRAEAAAWAGEHRRALDLCVDSLPHLPNYADYVRRYEKPAAVPFLTLDRLARDAPPLFHRGALRQTERFLAAEPSFVKKASRDFAAELRVAWDAMAAAADLWDRLTALALGAPVRPAPASAGDTHRLALWRQMGLLGPDFDDCIAGGWVAVCSACGLRLRAAKLTLLETYSCPKCLVRTDFTLCAPGAAC